MTVQQHQPIDFSAIRAQLQNADGPTYWRSLEQLAERADFTDFMHHEFPRLAPLWDQAVDRRSVLKLMAASMALAGLSACHGQPGEEIVPYVNVPENLVPGNPRYYATTALVGGYAHGVIAKSNEGRPTKLEGNPAHPATLGALDAWSQASVLSLYDPDRSQTVLERGELATYENFLTGLEKHRRYWDANDGQGLCLLTGAVTSPSVAAKIAAMQKHWPRMRWFTHEPTGRENVWAGAQMAFNQRLEPRYDFTAARTVLTLDADFMGHEPGFLRYARDFMAQRRPTQDQPKMARLYAVESNPTVTGSVADHRQPVAADRIESVARHLAKAVGVDVPTDGAPPVDKNWLAAAARDLQSQNGAALVLAGANQPPPVHALAHAINQTLGAVGRTVSFQQPVDAAHKAEDLAALVEVMRAGAADAMVVIGTNPVYSAPADLEFSRHFSKLVLRLHCGEYVDETARLCHWHIPATHPLEAWGDARAYDGTASLIQPLIEPLYAGRTPLQFLHGVTEGADIHARDALRAHWQSHAKFDTHWKQWLQDGVIKNTTANKRHPKLIPNLASRLPASAGAKDGLTLQFAPDMAVYDGRYANNGWLQELSRPISKITWGNAALVCPALAERDKLSQGDGVRLSLGDYALELPVYVLPGHPDHAVTVNLGYGREAAGRIGDGVGANAYRLQSADAPWFVRSVKLEKTGQFQRLATTQNHHAMEGRDLIRAASLEQFKQNPDFAHREPQNESLYPEPWPRGKPAERQWGMSIDVNACIGCNACVSACQAENNIPVVGETEVARGHDMHWIRIDRYFEGAPEAPKMVHQPVPCMHCENAPCEYVCPVEATQHSAEGLNEMIYNRCVGTRYCSQNCPYKVRRFNWFDYSGEDTAFKPEPNAVHNPDVTVRSRGVMEKCTYCVQRIHRAEIEADVTDLPIADGDIVTACQQACPTQAIVFGDIADPGTAVSQAKANPLNYGLLENLNTRPRTTYMAAVRNPNPEIEPHDSKEPPRGDG